jgi:hypothetical protein
MTPGRPVGLDIRANGPSPGLRGVDQIMTTIVVQYRVMPERADENQQLIEAVFAELESRQPEGSTYKAIRLDDGVSFIRIVTEQDSANPDSLQAVPAIQGFVADIGSRCDVPPVAKGASIVGRFR